MSKDAFPLSGVAGEAAKSAGFSIVSASLRIPGGWRLTPSSAAQQMLGSQCARNICPTTVACIDIPGDEEGAEVFLRNHSLGAVLDDSMGKELAAKPDSLSSISEPTW